MHLSVENGHLKIGETETPLRSTPQKTGTVGRGAALNAICNPRTLAPSPTRRTRRAAAYDVNGRRRAWSVAFDHRPAMASPMKDYLDVRHSLRQAGTPSATIGPSAAAGAMLASREDARGIDPARHRRRSRFSRVSCNAFHLGQIAVRRRDRVASAGRDAVLARPRIAWIRGHLEASIARATHTKKIATKRAIWAGA